MASSYSDAMEGERIRLIPYRQEHVAMYHKWLESPEIQELTETEPCSLEEEHQFQREWEADNQRTKLIKLMEVKASPPVLIGDVNLFALDTEEAEINIMIAETDYRNRLYAREAVDLLVAYVQTADSTRNVKRIVAKILRKNTRSIHFFERCGFVLHGTTAFDELVMVRKLALSNK